jgi:hypothetical protein
LSSVTVNTDVSVPVLTGWTSTFLQSFVINLTWWAVDGANVSVEGLSAWALALVGNVVVESSSSTNNAGDSVPGWWNWAFAVLGVDVPGLSVGADDACISVPELAGWADAGWRWSVPDFSWVASVNAFSSVPLLWSNTSDAGLSIVVWSSWAVSDTVSIVKDWVTLAGSAAGSENEDVVEAEPSEVAESVESELVSVPGCGNSEIGSIVVQDESVDAVEINNVSTNVWHWGVDQVGRWQVSIEKIVSDINVAEFAAVSNVTDEQWVNLSDGCDRDSDGDSGFIDFFVDDLDFKRWVAAADLAWTDFKSLEEG